MMANRWSFTISSSHAGTKKHAILILTNFIQSEEDQDAKILNVLLLRILPPLQNEGDQESSIALVPRQTQQQRYLQGW